MTQPAVTITELDNALGILPASAGKLYAVVGVCTGGTANTPAAYGGSPKGLIADFTDGPAVEAAAYYLERFGKPVVIVKTGVTTAGAAGSVTTVGTGTSVVTASGASRDDYDLIFKVTLGGTIATGPISFQYSLDGGNNYSPVTSLGTANSFVVPNTGLTLNFGAGTMVTGDVSSLRATAPLWNSTQLGTALDALKSSALNYEVIHIVGAIDGTAFDLIETKIAGFESIGKTVIWIGNCRVPNAGESESAYLTAMTTIFGSKATTHGALCYGADAQVSSVSGRKYRRPVSFVVAALSASVSEEVDIADSNLGPLVGTSIRDANGNPLHHDESLNPGGDDARFVTLRTWEGKQGVYVNRPLLMSAAGSDFQLIPHRRVLNLARVALNVYFQARLNHQVLVDAKTGFILEEEAQEMEAGAKAAMDALLLAKPKASGTSVSISRTDNLLSTKTMNVQGRVIPLAYIEAFAIELGFNNPAMNVVGV